MNAYEIGMKHLKQAESAHRDLPRTVEQHTGLAIASFLGGILYAMDNGVHILASGGEEDELMKINAWLRGEEGGRPEVIVHRAEDMTAPATTTDAGDDLWESV